MENINSNNVATSTLSSTFSNNNDLIKKPQQLTISNITTARDNDVKFNLNQSLNSTTSSSLNSIEDINKLFILNSNESLPLPPPPSSLTSSLSSSSSNIKSNHEIINTSKKLDQSLESDQCILEKSSVILNENKQNKMINFNQNQNNQQLNNSDKNNNKDQKFTIVDCSSNQSQAVTYETIGNNRTLANRPSSIVVNQNSNIIEISQDESTDLQQQQLSNPLKINDVKLNNIESNNTNINSIFLSKTPSNNIIYDTLISTMAQRLNCENAQADCDDYYDDDENFNQYFKTDELKENSIPVNNIQHPKHKLLVNNGEYMKDSNNNRDKEKQHKKPWYSAFINTYKQKNEEFKKLFKLSQEEHLLVDYSCALQREILAHGRLYISLNYVCFRANIIGWETTLIIKLKDIKSIYKDKTAKIIPNAISIVLDNEKYFLTSFVSRDKTYTTLFRVWQIALADASMSQEEISNILKTFYGEDLGYNSDDADYEYYSKLKAKSTINSFTETLTPGTNNFYNNPQPFTTGALLNKKKPNMSSKDKQNASQIIFDQYNLLNSHNISSTASPKVSGNSKSKKYIAGKSVDSDGGGHKTKNKTSTPESSKVQLSQDQSKRNSKNTQPSNNNSNIGHRQSSSYDATLIDTSDPFSNEILVPVPNTTGVWLKRPRSMVVTQTKNTNQIVSATSSKHSDKANNLEHNNQTPKTPTISPNSNNRSSIESNNNDEAELKKSEYNSDNNDEDYQALLKNNIEIQIEPHTTTTNNLNPTHFSTSSPIQTPFDSRDSSSSSVDLDQNDEISSEIYDNAKCSCEVHNGKEMLNQVFNLSLNALWEALFGHTTFCQKYWESRKFGNIQIGDWKPVDSLPVRRLEYTVDLGGAIGRPKNTEDQRILEYRPDQCIVLESESVTHGVPYADYFTVKNRFCLTRCSTNTTKLFVTSFLNYIQKPNFIAKSFIERNCMGALRDSYNYLANLIANEYANTEKFCHECISQAYIAAIFNSNLILEADNNNINNNNLMNSIESITAAQPQSDHLHQDNVSSEKKLPYLPEPENKQAHISAYYQDTIKENGFRSSSSYAIKKDSDNVKLRHITHGDRRIGTNDNNNDINNSINDKYSDETEKIANSTKHRTIPGSTTSSSFKKIKNQQIYSNELTKRVSEQDSNHINQTNSVGAVGQQYHTQLVRIQKFSFFKWEINVDTLVRLFIVAMIFLMVINGMLYYKLRRIETLADSLRSDPNIMLRMTQQESSKLDRALLNRDAYSKEIYNWRDLITNTLTAIEKMESSLRDWDKSLETRQRAKEIKNNNPNEDL